LATFVQRLAIYLTSVQATTFIVGEYNSAEPQNHPVSTIADGIVWLSQNVHRNSMVRKIQALKMRGQATQPGLHTMRITNDGVSVFPRMLTPVDEASLEPMRFISSGIPGLDEMLGGQGFIAGSAILVAGPAGSGKSTVA